jgi:REP element-mobilizing transposase RayT
MAIRTIHDTVERTWFITFTCYNWIPLLEITHSYELMYHWLKLIRERFDVKTVAFVFMPNHIHLLLHLPVNTDLNKMISNAKRFIAYEIVKRLKASGNNSMLLILNQACTVQERNKGQHHKVFEPSFDAKAIFSEKFLHQKLDYIHFNPVSGKWKLATTFVDYLHSSAAFYEQQLSHPWAEICHYLDLEK